MTVDIYTKLREQLDEYSIGFPATKSGVEMKILERLFAEDEAEMYLLLSMKLETPAEVAARLGREEAETAGLLDRMAEKGLAFRLRRDDVLKYAAVPFLVGIWEYQIKNIDRELSALMEQYGDEAFNAIGEGDALMRPIPIGRSIDVRHRVATYEDARHFLKDQKKIAVLNCICRVQQGLLGQGCDKPLEVCFMFGSHASYCVERGVGREVSYEEAVSLVEQAEEAGLVCQPFNSQNPGGMCNCCGDCCGLLKSLKKHPRPADMTTSNYFAMVDKDACTACETCLERCQMEAITINEQDTAEIDLARCIGCGLCVTTCPTEAMTLAVKPEAQRYLPPQSGGETLFRLAEQRGKSLIPISMREK
jgi:Pyruvate/2-oxoacid:ferredoxin oxidoreductase delta subunit